MGRADDRASGQFGARRSGTHADPSGGGPGVSTVGVVGAGAMGRGIAQLLATAGCEVLLHDTRPGAAEEAVASVVAVLDRLVTRGRLSEGDRAETAQRLHAVDGLRAFGGADLVVEAVVEDLAVKRAVFAELDDVVAADAVLATNTSSLSVTALAAGTRHPRRVCGLHFFNPVPLMRLVEVVPGELTDPDVVDRLLALVDSTGHTGVRVSDTPGFLVNHAGRAYSTEGLRLLDEGVAPAPDLDRVLREAAGFRMGPFELFDLTGLDVSQPVMETVWSGFYGDPRLRPSPTGRRRLAAGRLGRKSGGGFYDYADGAAAVPPEQPAPDVPAVPVWVDPESAEGTRLADELDAHGVPLDEGARPGAGSVALVLPWGSDVTTALLAAGLPPERTLGVDPFGPPGALPPRLTLAATPATHPAAADAAWAALARTGRPVTRTADSPGFVAQRVVACVVGLACEIAQLGLAAPDDVDAAVRLALGYPRGPLAWGDEIGPARVLGVLEGLHAATGDPRYRPSPWLVRRARLGVSLLTPDSPWERG